MNPETARPVTTPKYMRVANNLRVQIAKGILLPGQSAPSGAALSRTTGYSVVTCRRALRTLIRDGVLVPGTSRNARPRVPSRSAPSQNSLAGAARILSTSLATLRRAAGMTQPQLAQIAGVSVTTIGHAETGRLWQSRRFWENADKGLSADGKLLTLYDAFRAAAAQSAEPGWHLEEAETGTAAVTASSGPVACVTITWVNGEVTTVYPPHADLANGTL